jgi:hypothetical protein
MELKETRKKSRRSLSSDSIDSIGRQLGGDDYSEAKDDDSLPLSTTYNDDAAMEEISPRSAEDATAENCETEDTKETEEIPLSPVEEHVEECSAEPVEEASILSSAHKIHGDNYIQIQEVTEGDRTQNTSSDIMITDSTDQGDVDGEDFRDTTDNLTEDQQTQASAQKKRKKRTPSILKDLEIPQLEKGENEQQSATESNVEENGAVKVYQSSRTAAKVAKSKISGGKSTASRITESATTSGAKLAKKSKENKEAVTTEEVKWIQCDECSKWRSIPPSTGIDIDSLPEKWFCYMNTWDEARNKCDVPEEDYQAVDPLAVIPGDELGGEIPQQQQQQQQRQQQQQLQQQHQQQQQQVVIERTLNSAVKNRANKEKRAKKAVANDGEFQAEDRERDRDRKEKDLIASARKKERMFSSASKTASASKTNLLSEASLMSGDVVPAAAVSWVQCNRCKKWRKAPDVENLPDKWFCSLNNWAPQFASCSVKQEDDETTNEQTIHSIPYGGGVGAGGKGKRANAVGMTPSVSSSAIPSLLAIGPNGSIVKKMNWVQCERKGCKKWRKVPPNIDIDSLPEKWYCEMNTWNLDSASCEVPEDSDSEAENADNNRNSSGSGGSTLILSNPKGPTALSYRRIIFGNDGKIKSCFSDKNKNGYGLFSSIKQQKQTANQQSNDEFVEPLKKISYWWSSSYIGEVNQQHELMKNEQKPEVGLLEENNASSFFLLNTIRRIHHLDVIAPIPQPKSSFPLKVSKSWELLQSLPLLTRLKGECTVIRSCFVSHNSSSMSLSTLMSYLKKCSFLHVIVEACREFMSFSSLKDTLHRLEENDEVDIAFSTATNEMIITILQPLTTLKSMISSKSMVFNRKINKPMYSSKWLKQGIPLKMRKFFLRKESSSSTSSDAVAAHHLHIPHQHHHQQSQHHHHHRGGGSSFRPNPSNISEIREESDQGEEEEDDEGEGGGYESRLVYHHHEVQGPHDKSEQATATDNGVDPLALEKLEFEREDDSPPQDEEQELQDIHPEEDNTMTQLEKGKHFVPHVLLPFMEREDPEE